MKKSSVMLSHIGVWLLLIFSVAAQAFDMASYEAKLIKEVNQAELQYQRQVAKVSKSRQPILNELSSLEVELIELRQQLLGQTRAQDDAYLSVQAMEQRLSQWQEQNRYIFNLLMRHSGNQQGSPLALVHGELTSIGGKLAPSWHPGKAIASNGALVTGQILRLGPLGYLHHDNQLSILNMQGADKHKVAEISLTLTVDETFPRSLPVDITGNRAITIEANHKSWYERINQGGFWVFPILAMGLLAFAVAVFKAWQLRGQPKPDCGFISRYLADGVLPLADGWQALLVAKAEQHQGCGSDAMADYLHQYLLTIKAKQEKGMALIAATAAVAPLMGLLGTVGGMIQTFEMMNLFGNQDSSVLSGGISEALVTTELGLVVAIPALLLHAWLSRKHQGVLSQLEADAGLLCQLGDR
ncbi:MULTISPECIES: MotA/TolQ/ExbB proton channel family protein [Shewanella]|uniref:MotA/TolQ/ExbB proton channel family protein n=1 Tax=Shewanella fidelis TaxID=173509 RepID=A0AAW8NKZ2_9GAMM|nr:MULTISPECIES: MotA/TolQ/ExbB proton channel family protein [Shewanella]MDR8522573.1 MotA/TolQ/ExbB proton channel family protein [Shewanella fidelis]MDW4812189.1 MotA/TolQ/ExbB proton channel family protein [Shewanella fidelis]MDW4816147.1 MotA/TolQ/ExbB proton channel family protein [Shewanella fidelis]MDW4820430.1 MotA/TolQ/ExbB proton channel family protein [Shewanella fidelis]MDW4824652.1 MotA/TolQ/ExbB proton channel family protein [Shewanella fidelis]